MKRALLFLALLVAPTLAAAQCTSKAACATAPCGWSTGFDNGTGCTAPPDTAEPWTISAGHTVVVDADGTSGGQGTLNGTLLCGADYATPDAQGFVDFTLKTTAAQNIVTGTGVFRARKGCRINHDSTSGLPTWAPTTGFVLDVQGEVTYATVASATLTLAKSAVCGPGANGVNGNGDEWALTFSGGVEAHAQLGRPIYFLDGGWRAREYEIMRIAGSTVTVCAGLPDAVYPAVACDGANRSSCGERFRGHVAVGAFPDGTPSAPAGARHSVPTDMQPATAQGECTGDGAPDPYCTGANAKEITATVTPAAGDHVAIIQDVWIMQSAGTAGFVFNLGFASPMPFLTSVNIQGGGSAAPQYVMLMESSSSAVGNDVRFVNVGNSYGGIHVGGFRGASASRPMRYSNNVCHDMSGVGVQNGGCFEILGRSSPARPIDDVWFTDNDLYRTTGNALQFNAQGQQADPSHRNKVQRNRVHEGCTNTGSECNGLEVAAAIGADVSYNAINDFDPVDHTSASCLRVIPDIESVGLNSAVHHNWAVNCQANALIAGVGSNGGGRVVGTTANYFANTGAAVISGGRAYGNVLRNAGLTATATVFNGARYSAGNMVIGNDELQRLSASCNARICSSVGISQNGTDNPSASVEPCVITDTVVANLDDTTVNAAYVWPNSSTLPMNATVGHVTCDGIGSGAVPCVTADSWTPSAPMTFTVSDVAAFDTNGGATIHCTADANRTDVLGTYFSANAFPASLSSGLAAGCDSVGTAATGTSTPAVDKNGLDYAIPIGLAALTGGASPSGSSLGSRGFYFDVDAITSVWPGLPFYDSAGSTGRPPFPKNFCNVIGDGVNIDCRDTDGDGIMDFLDNCPRKFNPSQYDGDGDGIGCACETSGDACP